MLNTRALRIVRSFFTLTLRLIVQTFPVRHCSLTRSLSLRFHASSLDVSATGPKTTKNPRHCPWRDPDISPLTSQLTNPAHHLRIFHFFTHHGPTADRPSVHGTSRHHHHHTLARSLYTVPRSLARLALALARSLLRLSLSPPPPNPVAVRESEIPLHLLYANAHTPDISSCNLRVSIYIRLFHSHGTIRYISLSLINDNFTLSRSFPPSLFLAVPIALSLFNQLRDLLVRANGGSTRSYLASRRIVSRLCPSCVRAIELTWWRYCQLTFS